MTKPNPFLWPKRSRVNIYNGRGERLSTSKDRRYDLADAVMVHAGWSERTVYIGIDIDPSETSSLESGEAEKLAKLIRYDFGMDGFGVTLTQLEPNNWHDTYFWKVRVRPML